MAEALLIDGKAIAATLQQDIAGDVASLKRDSGVVPGLAAVLVGDDPASQVYVRSKVRACAAVGLACFQYRLPSGARLPVIIDLVRRLNAGDRIDGILVQLPLPPGIDGREVIATIDPAKDIDGFHPLNVGRL